jgi:hypothetical protein
MPRGIIPRLNKKRVLLNNKQKVFELHNFSGVSDLMMIKLPGIIIYRNGDLNK